MNARQRFAIEAVAAHFSATWKQGEAPADAYVAIAGKPIPVVVADLRQRTNGREEISKPCLRYDRVALWFVRGLQSALRPMLASGEAIILTTGAPIRVPKQAAAALKQRVGSFLARNSQKLDAKESILGNRIRVRLLRNGSAQRPEVIGFVHSVPFDPGVLLNATQSLLEQLRLKEGKRSADGFRARCWLVVVGDSRLSETYRDAYSQLSNATGFERVLLVTDRGNVESLSA